MVTRHRVNLSFSEVEYAHLSQLAASQGKTPTTLVADVIKFMLMSAMRSQEPLEAGKQAEVAGGAKKRAKGPQKPSEGG